MNTYPVLRIAAVAVAAAVVAPSARAIDFGAANPLNWFKEKEAVVPGAAESAVQEAAAQELLRDAKSALATGNTGRAQDLFKEVVFRYRFTSAAAVAQFEHASLVRRSGKLQDAYDAFQKFVDNYRQSPRFNEAIQQQFEIAEE
ncbi:MAG: hypothetical protein ACOYMN_25165, partial [Roseimicrobium sp.]